MLYVNFNRDFDEFRFHLKKILCESTNSKEILIFGVFNLESATVRKIKMEIEIKSFSGFLLGLELGIGHWDNHKLLGFSLKQNEN